MKKKKLSHNISVKVPEEIKQAFDSGKIDLDQLRAILAQVAEIKACVTCGKKINPAS